MQRSHDVRDRKRVTYEVLLRILRARLALPNPTNVGFCSNGIVNSTWLMVGKCITDHNDDYCGHVH